MSATKEFSGAGTSGSTSSRQRSQASRRPSGEESKQARTPRQATLNLPYVSIQMRAPDISVPTVSRRELTDAANAAASVLPPAPRLAYYTGLGALAVLEVIEWPVALAIGVGTVVVRRAFQQSPGGGTTAEAASSP